MNEDEVGTGTGQGGAETGRGKDKAGTSGDGAGTSGDGAGTSGDGAGTGGGAGTGDKACEKSGNGGPVTANASDRDWVDEQFRKYYAPLLSLWHSH